MLEKQYRSLRTTPSSNKRDLLKQNFYVHQPLLEHIIQLKLEKCLKYGHLRERSQNLCKPNKNEKVHVVEAPCILGNSKKIEIRFSSSKKSLRTPRTKEETRPKTSNTVIRSRTT